MFLGPTIFEVLFRRQRILRSLFRWFHTLSKVKTKINNEIEFQAFCQWSISPTYLRAAFSGAGSINAHRMSSHK